MVTSQDFFQPLRDYLREPPKVSREIRFLQVRVAGNRAESNPFVLYAYASWVAWQDPLLTGGATQYFSDRVAAADQPFDAHETDSAVFSVAVPDGPVRLTRPDNGAVIAQFRTIEYRDDGFLVCANDYSRSIIVVSLTESTVILF